MGSDVIVPPPERIDADVLYLKEWLSKQPHLPEIQDNEFLKTFLYNNKFSLEKTKYKLENYYSLRTKYPEFLKNLDPTSPDQLIFREAMKIGASVRSVKGNTRILYFKYEADAKKFDPTAYARRIFMLSDAFLLDEGNRLMNCITIIDFQHFRYLHLVKIWSNLLIVAEILNKAYTERNKAIHLINFPAFAHSLVAFSMKLFSNKMQERLHVHSAGRNTLLEIVDEDILCSDYGGKGPSLADLEDQMQKELERHKGWFQEQTNVCSNELRRIKDSDQVEELKGSFRKLEVD